jgi:arginyl-tRNA synthetase
MIKDQLEKLINQSIEQAIASKKLGQLTTFNAKAELERPRLPEHGDFALGIALKLAGLAKMAPLKIAEAIMSELKPKLTDIADIEAVPPGYINFRLKTKLLEEVLLSIHKEGNNYGQSNIGQNQKVLIEYVSANPTGDLHIGHARNAVFGSCLTNLFKFAGFDVEQEFYINDAGEQIVKFGRCIWSLYLKLASPNKQYPYPEEGYPEDSLIQYVEEIISKHNDKYVNLSDDEGIKIVGTIGKDLILESQKKVLHKLGIDFNRWYSELSLHEDDRVNKTLNHFAQKNISYESEGAIWLKTKELGDERDRVLQKSTGNKTYLAVDAAYHLDKLQRNYDLLINIWGADHHGQVPSLKATIQALGADANKLEIILTQIVNLSSNGQIVRMSKRMGTVVLLSDLIEEVGVDAVRYYLAESNPQNPISFDLELAKKTSKENPAFYIQYAHARCSAILRKALEPSINTETKQEEKPPISALEWKNFQDEYKNNSDVFKSLFDNKPEIFFHQKALIMRLDALKEEVEEAVQARLPGRLARYAYELANDLQKFYETCRVITDDLSVTKARLGLILATKQVLANVLAIIGISAPEKM